MENMWAVLVYQYTVIVVIIVCIACNMVALGYNQYLFIGFAGKSFRQYATRKTSSNNQVVKSNFAFLLLFVVLGIQRLLCSQAVFYKLHHLLPGIVPRVIGEEGIRLCQPFGLVLISQLLCC